MKEFIKNLHNSAPAVIKKRLYLHASIVASFLLTMIFLSIWTGNTLTMMTAIARFERTHTVSRLEAKAALLEYLETGKDRAKASFFDNMAVTQSYNKVFGNLLVLRTSTSEKEFVHLLENTFKEANHKTAVIIVNRIKVLYWHPIVKELVGYAEKAHHSGETILALAPLAMVADNKELEQSVLQKIRSAEKDFVFYERSFSRRCSDLAAEIATFVDYFSIVLLILSVGFTGLVTMLLAKAVLQQTVKHARDLEESRERLKEKSDFLDKIIESAALSTWISDEKGTVIRTNPACLEFFGATEDEVIGKYNLFQDVVLEKSGFMPEIRAVFEKGKPANIVIDYDFGAVDHVEVKNATHKIINSIFTPIKDDHGKISNVIVQTIDLTDIKRMEKELIQSRKMESIGTLAGGIAHDFNNILASVLGYTELALDEVEKGTPLSEKLQEVLSAGKRARDLVKQILAFARQSNEERKPIQVAAIAKEVLKLIRSTIPATIEIRENLESHSLIIGNPSQIHQLFMNLCTNAAHALEEAGGVMGVELTDVKFNDPSFPLLDLKPGNYMKIIVSDTGTGISPDIIDSVFEPYFTTKDVGEGTGMGLALVHGIVESHGGKIMVDSEPGKGTVFSIYLPVTQQREFYRQYETETLPTGTERILFIDDELSIARMGRQILERLGYRVAVRTGSLEALELFRSKPDDFDLVITDMTMPDMTGDQLAMELIASRSDIPVILFTGYSKKITDKKAAKIGIKAFAYKPIAMADLAKTVRKVLDEANKSASK